MKDYGKKLTGFAIVALISSGISVGAYAMINSSNSNNKITDELIDDGYAKPTGFTRVSNRPPVETDFTKAAENTVNAVVSIKSTSTPKQDQFNGMNPFFEYFFGYGGKQPAPQPRTGLGSGVIISPDGYIVTNNHVVEGADKLDITLNDNRVMNGRVIGTDPSTDLALVKIDAKDLPSVRFGDSDKLKVGEWVLAVGNPMGLTSTVTAGIVSAKARSISSATNSKQMGIESFIQTDAAINRGNSGGALVNTDGELVGINTAIYSETGSYAGYSFAIPTSIVSKIIADLKEYGTVQRAVMGIGFREINPDFAKEKSLNVQEGIYVGEVYNRSAAMEAGIKEGDIITAVNGVKIKNAATMQEQMSRYRPGDKIKVTILRNNQNKELALTLKNSQGNTEVTKLAGIDSLGAGFKELSDKTKRELNIGNGVQVIGIKNGKFKDAGIREGFVILEINDTPIRSISNIEEMFDNITKSNNDRKVMFITGIYPNGKVMYYAIDLAE
ncbi:MAG: Do family serine endopeptidase [Barnesiella sp.]